MVGSGRGGARVAGAAALLLSAGGALAAPDRTLILQWFETSWRNIENRAPDAFMIGYNALWTPPPSIATFGSPGYDPFDRFNLGTPTNQTIYGTEGTFREMVQQLRRAGILVYPDLIFNHNGARSTVNSGFLAAGGWPGFHIPGGSPFNWGDFHDTSFQSENPGGPNFNLFNGDLVGLIDIAHEFNIQFIRHPVAAGDPRNIPAGSTFNRPDAGNARFYPDRDLPPMTFVNPINNLSSTVFPFNLQDPLAGDAVPENATGLLQRFVHWMLEDLEVGGYRLDASQHVPQFVWNEFFDTAVFNQFRTLAGTRAVPLSFGENVNSNGFIQTFVRNRDGFANRDALDINEAGSLRNVNGARGFASWLDPIQSSLDNQDDGFNNGSQGVHHVFSHDNGSAGSGSSIPPLPAPNTWGLAQNAYVLFRSGIPIVYHNSREMVDRFASGRGAFWPREGNPSALGNFDGNLAGLVRAAANYVRADNANTTGLEDDSFFFLLNGTDAVNSSLSDALVFERSNFLSSLDSRNDIGINAAASVLVGVSDSFAAGFQVRSVQTSFVPGTVLVELTGNAADPVVNPAGAVAQTLTVDANRRVLITIPNNTSPSGFEHGRGYVAYGPQAPVGTLSFPGSAGVIPPDPETVPSYARRLTPLAVITGDQFEVRLDTGRVVSAFANGDDNAVFRIDQGFRDFNGSGSFDFPESDRLIGGYENFVTQRSPLAGPGFAGTAGLYRQTIDATTLDEGVHFVSAIAFLRRTDGGAPIINDFRGVVYVDRLPPQIDASPIQVALDTGSFDLPVLAADRATNAVHVLINPPAGADPLTLAGPSNQARVYDRFEYRLDATGALLPGANRLVVVAFELSGRATVEELQIVNNLGSGDVNQDGVTDINDLYDYERAVAAGYIPQADLASPIGSLTGADLTALQALLRGAENATMRGTQP